MNDGGEERHRDPEAGEERRPEDDRLGDAVKEGAEDERHASRRGYLATAPRPGALKEPVACVEGDGTGGETDAGGDRAGRLECLVGQVERQCADERPGAEPHHQRDEPAGDVERDADEGPDDER